MTILYDSKDTLRIILRRKGSVWKKVIPFCLLTVGISIVTYYLEYTYEVNKNDDDTTITTPAPNNSNNSGSESSNFGLTFDDAGHKMLATMVAYLVVSRVNSAYCRFWEARTLLSHALANARQFSTNTVVFTNQDTSESANEWRIEVRV